MNAFDLNFALAMLVVLAIFAMLVVLALIAVILGRKSEIPTKVLELGGRVLELATQLLRAWL